MRWRHALIYKTILGDSTKISMLLQGKGVKLSNLLKVPCTGSGWNDKL